jgi:hypothetical protein
MRSRLDPEALSPRVQAIEAKSDMLHAQLLKSYLGALRE